MGIENSDIEKFLLWFQSSGGHIDTNVMGIVEFPGQGRGAIALNDIREGHTLFTLPRTITLSTRTSPLPFLFGLDAWRLHGLHKGWIGLILCMMWEDAWAHEMHDMGGDERRQTRWGPYMRTLPTTFDTPMFWNAEELKELQGTAVLDKIGRDDAERAYSEQLIPAIKTSPTLFPPSHHGKWYSLDAYHCAGSRILSRSFTVSRWADDDHNSEAGTGGNEADENEDAQANVPIESFMNIGNFESSPPEDIGERVDSDEEDEADEGDPSDVAMVPMADILNAKWGSGNAKLFYEPLDLRMVTTRYIKQGEQILNTYGDPPNSDLLRRYGHIDLVQISSSSDPTSDGDVQMEIDNDIDAISRLGNPSDVVEIGADLVVNAVGTTGFGSKEKDMHARIEWWLDEGEDDTFVIAMPDRGLHLSAILPPALVSLIRLLILPEPDFHATRSKGKIPRGKLEKGDKKDNSEVVEVLDEVFKCREGMYLSGTVEDDERLLSLPDALTTRKRNAVIVRLGEKRILRNVRQVIRVMLTELRIPSKVGCEGVTHSTRTEKKNKRDIKEAGSSKKRAIDGEGDRGWKKARK